MTLEIHLRRPRCPFCRDQVAHADSKVGCPWCMTWLHASCLREHGACPACGAVPAPGRSPDEPRVEVSRAYRLGRAIAARRRSDDELVGAVWHGLSGALLCAVGTTFGVAISTDRPVASVVGSAVVLVGGGLFSAALGRMVRSRSATPTGEGSP